MYCTCEGFLLDEQKGSFTSDDGRRIDYHKARFYDTGACTLFKVTVPDSAALPEPQVSCRLTFDCIAGEKYCKLSYVGSQPLD